MRCSLLIFNDHGLSLLGRSVRVSGYAQALPRPPQRPEAASASLVGLILANADRGLVIGGSPIHAQCPEPEPERAGRVERALCVVLFGGVLQPRPASPHTNRQVCIRDAFLTRTSLPALLLRVDIL
jgi:hypothetical protein